MKHDGVVVIIDAVAKRSCLKVNMKKFKCYDILWYFGKRC